MFYNGKTLTAFIFTELELQD